MRTCLNFCLYAWPEKNADKSGKRQGILIPYVSGNPA